MRRALAGLLALGLLTVLPAGAASAVPAAEGSAAFPVTATSGIGDRDLAGQPIGTDTDVDDGVIGDATPWIVIVLAVIGLLVALGLGALVAALVRRARGSA